MMTIRGSRWPAAVAVAVVLTVPPAAAAAPPDRLNYQGVLRDAADDPQDGVFAMEFRFYDAAAGGSVLLRDVHPAVTVTGGLFDVELGLSPQAGPPYASLAQMFRDRSAVFMEIQVGSEVLAPRIPVRSAAYALNADHLDGRDGAEFPLLASSNTFTLGNQTIRTGNLLTKGLIVQGAAGQTAGLQEWQNSLGAAVASVSAAGIFSGSGASLTNLNASNLASGILPSARLSGTYANALTFSNAANAFTGDGSGLTNVDASLLDGIGSAQFLRSDASDSFTGGTLTLNAGTTLDVKGNLFANGALRMDNDGPDGNQSIFFFEAASPTGRALTWDDADNRLEWNDGLALSGSLRAGSVTAAPVAYSTIGNGAATATSLITGVNDLFVTDDLQVGSSLIADTEIVMNEDGPDGTQSIRFYESGVSGGEVFFWDDVDDRFEFSDDVGINSLNLYLNASQIANAASTINFWHPEQALFETLRWSSSAFRFSDTVVVSDNLTVSGDLFVSGTKNFVQNHPQRADLSVVYTALEGDEAGTYTRGTARLESGLARVRLGETFAWVTNPDVGLTAHVTPRGAPADLYVESLTTTEMVVRGGPASAPDQLFDYVVMGLRIGYEEHPVVQPRAQDAPVPSRESWDRRRAARPDAPPHDALERFRGMAAAAGLPVPEETALARSLRRAIGEVDRGDEPEPAGPEPASPAPPSGAASAATAAPGGESEGRGGAEAGRTSDLRDPARPAPNLKPGLPVLTLSEDVEEGDLLALDPARPGSFRRAAHPEDPLVVGIAAGAPFLEGGELRAPVATAGIATARAEALDAPIAPGDLLVASSVPGHVSRAAAAVPGTVVGKALEGLESGAGPIRILVMPR